MAPKRKSTGTGDKGARSDSPSREQLKDALLRYDEATERRAASTSKSSREIVELDAWRSDELRAALNKRKPDAFLSKDELVKLLSWKVSRGTFRPSLMQLVQSNSDKQIESSTRAGASKLADGDHKAALKELTTLRGVGPALASGITSLLDAGEPYFSDEAVVACGMGGGKISYTPSFYERFREAMKERAEAEAWPSVWDLERAMWAHETLQSYDPVEGSADGDDGGSSTHREDSAPAATRKRQRKS